MKKSYILSCLLLSFSFISKAQVPFPYLEYIDINNISAAVGVHGDICYNPVDSSDACEFPKGSGEQIMSVSSLWMSGYDAVQNLHIAAQTYRQHGSDYWPGPLDSMGSPVPYAVCQDWARVWKVTAADIANFRAHPGSLIPSVYEWPGKGNQYAKGYNGVSLNITSDMAPFVDLNNNGIYEPQLGEYPQIKGDEMLWWVYNDNGPAHSETNGTPLQVEVHGSAYAYNRFGQAQLDDIIYYESDIINKSANVYDSFRVARFADLDIGNAYDDFIGFDTTHKMAFGYNGKDTDGVGQPTGDGILIPTAGIMLLDVQTQSIPQSSKYGYIWYYNDFSTMGNPATLSWYNDYLRARFHNMLFNDSLIKTDPFFECSLGNLPYDRRVILSTYNVRFTPGATMKVAYALVATPPALNNTCPNITMNNLDTVADTAIYYYWHQPPASVNNIITTDNSIDIYPNPGRGSFSITAGHLPGSKVSLQVFDVLGRVVYTGDMTVNNGSLSQHVMLAAPPGVYTVSLFSKLGYKRTARLVIY